LTGLRRAATLPGTEPERGAGNGGSHDANE